MGNGIHRRTAFDLANVEGCAGVGWDSGIDEAHGPADQSVDGIRHPEVGPAVAAWAGDQSFKPARGQRSGRHVIGAGTIKNHHGF